MSYPKSVRLADLALRQRVKVAGAMGGQLRAGVITAINKQRVTVRYDNTGVEREVSATRIRR